VRLPPGLLSRPIAHRGLWRAGGAPENSLAAFDRACRAGFGLELDVRLSSDGEAMVFHDDSLDRMTSRPGSIETLASNDLMQIPLADGAGTIPTLAQTLDLVAGRAMLLVEIKAGPRGVAALAARTAELLDGYAGPAAAISFEAEALAWFAEHRSERPRGLDAMALDQPAPADAFERACTLAQPDFLVLELATAGAPPAARRRAAGMPVIAWTVRSRDDAERAGHVSDNVIFEGFEPG
jgi:glycerophosphoryl diester phosphodiesterase